MHAWRSFLGGGAWRPNRSKVSAELSQSGYLFATYYHYPRTSQYIPELNPKSLIPETSTLNPEVLTKSQDPLAARAQVGS